jgi:dephospho-CoA kinase
MSEKPSIIGITGGIGAGKSVVSRYLRLNNIPVYDCDYSAKLLMNSDVDFKCELTAKLGDDTLDANGNINKRNLADKIFGNDDNLQIVNELVRILITKDIKKWIGEHSTDSRLAIESAILYSSSLYQLCDHIWLVTASNSTRISRVKQRSGLSDDEILQRINVQNKEYSSLPKQYLKEINNDDNCNIIKQLQLFLTV